MFRYRMLVGLLAAYPLTGAHAGTSCNTVGTNATVCVITAINASTVSSANASQTTYAWDSSNANNKVSNLNFSCTSAVVGYVFIVKDEIGTAGTYPITVNRMVGGSDTFDSPGGPPAKSFILNSNYESITFQCDGAYNSSGVGNWMVE
jgi:hypothetical protein